MNSAPISPVNARDFLGQFPYKLSRHIFTFFSFKALLELSRSAVSSQWHKLANDKHMWHAQYQRTGGKQPFDENTNWRLVSIRQADLPFFKPIKTIPLLKERTHDFSPRKR